VFTTAATATYTVLSGDTAHWANTQPERRRLAALLIALTAGAIAGGLLVRYARPFAPILPLVASMVVVGAAGLRFGRSQPTVDSSEAAALPPSAAQPGIDSGRLAS
jgi:uncharacterized membrane protein YfcA